MLTELTLFWMIVANRGEIRKCCPWIDLVCCFWSRTSNANMCMCQPSGYDRTPHQFKAEI